MTEDDFMIEDLYFEACDPQPPDFVCTGLVFRGYRSIFYNKKEYKLERREGIRLLKKQSCLRCDRCLGELDLLQEFSVEDMISFPDEIEHYALYGIVIHTSQDWETGYRDIDYIEIVKST